jgi:hypothetical protein
MQRFAGRCPDSLHLIEFFSFCVHWTQYRIGPAFGKHLTPQTSWITSSSTFTKRSISKYAPTALFVIQVFAHISEDQFELHHLDGRLGRVGKNFLLPK